MREGILVPKKLSVLVTLWFSLSAAYAAQGPGTTTDLDQWANEGRWKQGKNYVESTPAKQYAKARKLEEIGDVRQAAEEYRRLSDVFSESEQAEEGIILSAKCFLAAGDYTRCKEQITELRRRYLRPSFLDAMGQVECALARGYLEGKGEGGTYKLASRMRKATAIYKHIIDEDPEGRWADDALLGTGQCEEALGKYDEAIKRYKELFEKYPHSELRAEAEGRIAFCINLREPKPEYEETETREAMKRLRIAIEESGTEGSTLDAVALEENEKLLMDRQAQKRYDQAQFYIKNGKYRAAEVYLELIKARYPDSSWAQNAAAALEELRKR